MKVGRGDRAGLLDQRPEDPLVARHGARVCGGGRRSRLRRAHLEHRDPDPGVGACGKRLAQPGAVAVGLEVERHRAHALLAGQVMEEVGRLEHRLVAA